LQMFHRYYLLETILSTLIFKKTIRMDISDEEGSGGKNIPFCDVFHEFHVRSTEVYQVVAMSSFAEDKEFRRQGILSGS
jgi:hypothetical protein